MADTAPSGYSARPGRMVLPIRPREEATVTAMPHTPDGACEVILEVNGHHLGTWVVTQDLTHVPRQPCAGPDRQDDSEALLRSPGRNMGERA